MIRENSKIKFIPVFSALTTFLLFWIILFLLRVYPFGDVTLLIQDATGQYLDYFSYAQYAITHHHGLFYTFSRTLGGDYYGFITYYLSSPFNLLLLIGDRMELPLIFTLIIGLKLSVMSMAYAYSANRIFGVRWCNLLFAVAYAWIGYISAYYWSVIWLDALIAMPVIVSGLYTIIIDKRFSKAFFGGLLYAIITNYYIGYMCGIGSVLIFIMGLSMIKPDKHETGTAIKTFLAESLLSVLVSAFIWLPTAFALDGGRASFDKRIFDIDYNFHFLDLLSKFYSGAITNAEEAGGLPNIFCTSVILILVIIFFVDNRYELRNKVHIFTLISVFAVSFHIKSLNLIWHGFSENIGYPYRYSFILCLVLILTANKEFISITDGGIGYREPVYAAGIYMFISIILSQNDYEYITAKDSAFSIVIAMLTTAVILFCVCGARRRLLVFMLLVLIIIECMGNFYRSFLKLNGEGGALTMTRYENYLDMFLPDLDKTKETNYRMEVVPVRGISTPMLLDYKGISHFSSLEKTFVKNFIGRMGYRNNGNWTVYSLDSLKSADLFLGIKYVALGDERTVRENNALPILFMSDQRVSVFAGLPGEFCLFDESVPDPNTGGRGDIFEMQNTIWRSITGESDNIYNKIDILETNTGSDKVTWKIDIRDKNPLYLYISSPTSVESSGLYINGEYKTDYFGTYSWRAICVGEFDIGDQVEVSIRLSEDMANELYPYFYSENTQLIDKYANAMISRNTCVYTMLSDSHIEGKFISDEHTTYLMTTIPYDKGWHLEIDGMEVKPECLFGALMGAESSPGEHSFVLRYIPRGLIAGCMISFMAVMCVAGLCLKQRYQTENRKPYTIFSMATLPIIIGLIRFLLHH